MGDEAGSCRFRQGGESSHIATAVTKDAERPRESGLGCQSPRQGCLPTASPLLCWVPGKPTEHTKRKALRYDPDALGSYPWVTLTLRYPPAETSVLLSGEKHRSVTQPPWVAVPSSTESGAHKWRSWPFETFHIYINMICNSLMG